MGSNKEVKIKNAASQTTHGYVAQSTTNNIGSTPPQSAEKKSSGPKYPHRNNRYNMFGWNRNYQDCYDKGDIALLKKVKAKYDAMKGANKEKHYFDLTEEKALHDWWICERPADNIAIPGIDSESYTLPAREAKDAKQFPLWQYADSMARQIANWQAERIKNQDINVMNDPVRLIYDELRDWLFNELSSQECKKEVLDYISARQSYIKGLIHTIPDFGPDRSQLHELQSSLDDASRSITHCIANKELPQLLSELIISGKSLETATATYLHFLLINEEVADNFSSAYLDGSTKHCAASPICKIYAAANNPDTTEIRVADLDTYKNINRFYALTKTAENTQQTELELKLKISLTDKIKFASFVTPEIKANYLQTMAMLESLTKVRETLDKFQRIQSRIGTYVFAVNYLDQVDALAGNYINLVIKTRSLMNGIIQAADDGWNLILNKQGELHKQNLQFQKNLRSLEMHVADGVTTNALLEAYTKNSIESMNKYQQEIKKLVRNVQSGDAAREIEHDMQDLFVEMSNLNAVLPAILQDNQHITIKHEPVKAIMPFGESLAVTCVDTLPNNQYADPNSLCLEPIKSISDTYANTPTEEPFDPNKDPLQQHSGASSSRLRPPFLAPVKLLAGFAEIAKSWLSAPEKTIEVKKYPISEPTYHCPLTMSEWVTVGQYVGYYINKFSPYTFPWNREHELTSDEINHLNENSQSLATLKLIFASQKYNVLAKSGAFDDQYQYVKKNMRLISNEIKNTLKDKHSTNYKLNDIDHQLSRIDEMLLNIAKENHHLKKLLIEAERNTLHNKMSIFRRNITTNEISLTCVDADNNEVETTRMLYQ